MSGLVTQDWQLEFDGFLMGAGTPYQFTNLEGFLDLGGVRAPMTQRARTHGGYVEPNYASGATRTVDFNVSATGTGSSFAAAVNLLRAQTYPQDTTRPLWVQIPGTGLLTAGAQVLNRAIPIVQEYGLGLAQGAALQFYFPDPFWYGPTQQAATGLPTTSGGLVYPLAYPLAYATVTTGQVSAANPGSWVTSPRFTVTGPHDSGFQVTSIEDGLTLQYNGPLASTDTVMIDTRTGSVLLNGTDRSQLLTVITWPTIPAANPTTGAPGVRTFAFSTLGSYHAGAQLTVSWDPAYS